MRIVKNEIFYHIQKVQTWNIGQTIFTDYKNNHYFNYFNLYGHNYENEATGKAFASNFIADKMLEYLKSGNKDKSLEPHFSYDSYETIELLNDIIRNYTRYLREFLFEEVRQEYFPNYPSRIRGIFVIPNKDSINYWKKTIGATNGVVFEIELTGKIYEANHSLIKLTTNSFNWIRQQAFRYWIGENVDDDIIKNECVFEGIVKITRIVSEDEYGIIFE